MWDTQIRYVKEPHASLYFKYVHKPNFKSHKCIVCEHPNKRKVSYERMHEEFFKVLQSYYPTLV